MFTTSAHSAPTLSTTTLPASPTTPSRSTRLRGLSYIRQYTHNHLHSHPAPSPSPTATSGPCPTPTTAISSPSHAAEPLPSPAARDFGRPVPTHDPSSPTTEATPTSTSGWLPTVAGRSALSRIPTHQHSLDSSAVLDSPIMTRNRSETAAPSLSVRNQSGPTPTNMDDADHSVEGTPSNRPLPSIRFIPHHDPRAGRPSLVFPTISRTLPDDEAVIRVGRYSERDNVPEIPSNVPSAAAVGFKSKVVSRKHCEFWCADSQWYIKDVKSSSGTFLNHIRLSQPNVESKPFKVKDGDVVQLGIDFRGGEEMIFRCVKIRIECNRNWQQSINNFKYVTLPPRLVCLSNNISSKQTHQRLRNLAKPKKDTDSASTHSSECSICLMSIAVRLSNLMLRKSY
jgi:pSer/pThr/pTyr-binding forkhead associated (FHA) protein